MSNSINRELLFAQLTSKLSSFTVVFTSKTKFLLKISAMVEKSQILRLCCFTNCLTCISDSVFFKYDSSSVL